MLLAGEPEGERQSRTIVLDERIILRLILNKWLWGVEFVSSRLG
jgi:hypothetical protein